MLLPAASFLPVGNKKVQRMAPRNTTATIRAFCEIILSMSIAMSTNPNITTLCFGVVFGFAGRALGE